VRHHERGIAVEFFNEGFRNAGEFGAALRPAPRR